MGHVRMSAFDWQADRSIPQSQNPKRNLPGSPGLNSIRRYKRLALFAELSFGFPGPANFKNEFLIHNKITLIVIMHLTPLRHLRNKERFTNGSNIR